jgi:DNA-directed RNA polymerase subunit RPC12/RpoP
MPIRFRCTRCHRLLGIARRKAGTETKCPHCGAPIVVPNADPGGDERTRFDDIDELVNPAAGSAVSSPSQAAAHPIATRPAPPPRPLPEPSATPVHESDPPLFERDVDAVLETIAKPLAVAEHTRPKPPATSGMDTLSLGPEKTHFVISAQNATALVVTVVVLLAAAFGAGFLIGSR